MPFCEKLFLGRSGVHEDHVGIAPAGEIEGLPGTERHHPHLDPGLLPENRQDVAEQSRLLGRRGRGDDDELVLRDGRQNG